MYEIDGMRELIALFVRKAFSISNDPNRQACVEWLLDSGVRVAYLTRAQRVDKIVRDWWASVLNQFTRNV
jgi:hypothetical protein